MLAAVTPLPVIGVPVPLKYLDGMDSLLSIVQMPGGIPVATVAIGNAKNAGILAARILGTSDADLQQRLVAFQADLAEAAHAKGEVVREAAARRRAPARLLTPRSRPAAASSAIDVARCLALLGMVATHVLDERDRRRAALAAGAVARGRACLGALRGARRRQHRAGHGTAGAAPGHASACAPRSGWWCAPCWSPAWGSCSASWTPGSR